MITEKPPEDPRLLWQSQKREYPMMSLEEVRASVQAAQSKIRRNIIATFVTGGLILAVSVIVIVNIPTTPARGVGAGMIALTLALAYLLYSRMWARRPASLEASVKGCVRFYRKELEAQYRSVQLTWRLFVALAVFAFLTSNAVLRSNPLVPKIIVLSVLIVSVIVRHKEKREINRRLTALEAFEKNNP